MKKIKEKIARWLFKEDWIRIIAGTLSMSLGYYITTHSDYLDRRIIHDAQVDWLDDLWFGLIIVLIGSLLVVSAFWKPHWFEVLAIYLNAFVNGAFAAVFLVRDMDQSHNMTFIYATFATIAIVAVAFRSGRRRG